ncbi:MAG: autotransporter-associated beta strand repeat-containing protein [Candidatus Paceibacterota bacterium]
MIKNDSGTLTIQSISNFTGATNINKGTVLLNSNGAVPRSTVSINSGGTLTLDNTNTSILDRISDTAALTMRGGLYNFIGNSSFESSETAGALTLSEGHNIITVTPGGGGSTTMTFASLSRTAGSTALFRGTNLGADPGPNVSNIMFTSAPTLTGASGSANSTNISVVRGAFGDGSLSGTGSDMVTYNVGNSNGLRLLNGAGFSGEYSSTLSTNTNVKLTANTAASTVSINSLILNGFGITNASATITMASASLSGNILINSASNIAGSSVTLGITTFELPILATANSTISATIGTATTGSLTLSGSGNVTINSTNPFTGLTSINDATLTYGVSNVLSSGGVTVNRGTLDISGNSDTVGAVILQNGTITGGAGILTGTSYSFREGTVSAIIAGAGTVTRIATNTALDSVVTLTRDNTYSGVTDISSGILKLGGSGGGTNTPLGTTAGGTNIASGGALDLNGYTLGTAEAITALNSTGFGTAGSSNMGAIMNSSGSSAGYSGAITINGASRINADAGTLTISSAISGNFALTFGGFSNMTYSGVRSGTSTIVKDGIGVLTLSGESSYSGATTISVGTVKLGAVGNGTNTPLGTTGAATTVSTGARLDLNGYSLSTAEPLTLNGVGYGLGDFASGALINSSASSVTYSGLVTLGSTSTIKADYGRLELTAAGTITGSSVGLTLGGTGTGILSSIVGTVSGTVTKIDTGNWTLSGQSTYTGATSVNLGTLKLGANGGATNSPLGTAGTGTSVMTGAVLDFNGFTMSTAEGLTLNGRGINDGGAFIGSTGTFSGTVAQATDSRITNSSGGLLTLSGAVSGGFSLYVSSINNITFGVATATAGLSLVKQGSGTLTVTGANIHTGITRVDEGTFAYAGTTTLANTNLVMNGGIFNNGANADGIGTITLIGGTITNSAALTGAEYTFESGTVSGILAGAIPVTKNTNNTVTLSGVNTISSFITVNAGTLTISESGSAASVNGVTVNLGGTLKLDNSTTAVVDRLGDAIILTMNGGAFEFTGNSAGVTTETIGQLAIAAGHNTVTVTPGAGGLTRLTFANNPGFNRTAGASVLFRGASFGATPGANVSTLMFTTAPTLIGGGGAAGSTTISIIKGAFGGSHVSAAVTDMVTYDMNVVNSTGLRLLTAGEYAGDLQTANANVKLTADRVAAATNTNSLITNGFNITNIVASPTTIPIASASLSGNILINSANNIAGANTTLGITTNELIVLATHNSTISATIGTAVAGSLTLSGSGNVTLSATNPYTGTTFINGATLTAGANNVITNSVTARGATFNLNGNSGTIGILTLTASTVATGAGTLTLAGAVTTLANANYSSFITGNLGLGADRTFNIDDGLMDNDVIISAVISGSFALSKIIGNGVMYVSGNNTYTGLTTVNAGTIRLGAAGGGTNTPLGTTGAGTIVSGASSALDLNGFTLGTSEALTLSGALATGALQNNSSTAVNYTGLITLGAASTTIISNYGDINITNTGNITGNTFGLTIGGAGNGTLASNLNTSTGTLTKNGVGVWTVSGGASTFTGLTTISNGTLKLGSAGSGSNTPLGTNAGGVTVTSGAVFDVNGYTLATAEPIGSLAGIGITSGGSITAIGAFINSSNNSVSYSGAITMTATSRVANHGSGSFTLSGNIAGNFQLITVAVGTMTQSSASVWSGTGTLVKEGSGTLILAGQNSMTGAMTVSTGTLQLGASGGATNTPLGTNAGGVTVSSGAVLDFSAFSLGGASTYETLNISGSGIKNNGALIFSASGNNNFGAMTVAANARVVNNGGGTVTFGGTITAANSINLRIGGSGPVTFTGVYGASATTATITKSDAGVLTISAASVTTGLVRVNGGTLKYGILNALATPAVTVAGGTLDLNGFNETNIGAVTLIDGSIVNTGGAATLTSTATYTLENGTVSAVLGGTVVAAIAKNTGGRVILSGDNTFSGASATIAVNAGYLNLRHNNALGASGSANTTTVSAGATVELQNGITIPSTKAITINGLGMENNGAIRNVTGTNVISATPALGTTNARINSDAGSLTIPALTGNTFNVIFGGAGGATVSGLIGTASGTVTKDGAGTLTLSGANTYTGTTTIIEGTIIANTTHSIGTGAATNTLIFRGGTLQAAGTIDSPVDRGVNLYSGTATFDTSGNSISIAGTVGSTGSLRKIGSGTLTITGATTLGRDLIIGGGTFTPTNLFISGISTQSIDGFTTAGTITVNKTAGTATLQSAINGTTLTIDGVGGTLNLGTGLNHIFTGATTLTNGSLLGGTSSIRTYRFSSSNSNIRTLNMGSETWELTGNGTVWDMTTNTNATVVVGTSTVKPTDTSSSLKTFAGGGRTYNNFWYAPGSGTGTIEIRGSNTFNDFKDTGTAAHTILFTAGTTQTIASWNVSGNAGQLITIDSGNGAGSTSTSTHALVKSNNSEAAGNYLSIQHSVATPSGRWFAGPNSVNNQSVASAGSGWIFNSITMYPSGGSGNVESSATPDPSQGGGGPGGGSDVEGGAGGGGQGGGQGGGGVGGGAGDLGFFKFLTPRLFASAGKSDFAHIFLSVISFFLIVVIVLRSRV